MERSKLAIVIPAFNEASTIKDVILNAQTYGDVIVIDDASTDLTYDISINSGALVLKNSINLGYDKSLSKGFEKASFLDYEFILTMDADGQHNFNLIPDFIFFLEKGCDVVAGFRQKHQRFSEYLFTIYSNKFYKIRDPLCGMKAYNSSLYRELGHFDSYGSIGTELLFFALRNNKAVKQIQCNVKARMDEPRFGQIIFSNLRILRAIILTMIKV